MNGYYSLTENRSHFFADGKEHSALKSGDEIVIQIARAAMKGKDAVLTSNLSLTGRYAVLTAGTKGLGISSRITDTVWKQHIREQWESGESCPYGVIVRTNAYQAPPEAIAGEIRVLTEQMQALIDNGMEIVEAPDVESFKSGVQSVYDQYPQYDEYVARIQEALS